MRQLTVDMFTPSMAMARAGRVQPPRSIAGAAAVESV